MSYLDDPVRTSWRDEWVFEFNESELADKAQAKVDHHKERLNHWQTETDKLREEYIKSVQEAATKATEKEALNAEQLAAMTEAWLDADLAGKAAFRTASVTNVPGGFQPQKVEIMGDTETYQDLQKALAKINEHRGKVESFSRWVALLKRSGQDVRRLTYSDAQYFGF